MSRLPAVKLPRIPTLDLMRGYFLIAIILNHLYYWPSGYDWLTARGELFISAAEGFFLISGIVLGMVRGRKLLEKPFRIGASLLLKRSVQLYITYIILTLLFTFVGWYFIDNPGLKSGIAPVDSSLWMTIWNALSFQYLYGWADYLRLYALFILVAPLFLLLLRRNLWWVGMAISITTWLLSPVYGWPQSVYWQPLSWQLVFFSGMAIGFHWPELSGMWKRQSQFIRRSTVAILLSVAGLTLAYNVFLAFGGRISPAVYEYVGPIRDVLAADFFDKENLLLANIIIFFLWFWASFWLFQRFQPFITKYLGWILTPFGTNSLYVYVVHAFLVFFVHLILPAGGSSNILINFLLTTGVLAIIWLMVHYRVLFKIIPR